MNVLKLFDNFKLNVRQPNSGSALLPLWVFEFFRRSLFALQKKVALLLLDDAMPEAWDILKPRHSCIAASYHGTSRCNIVRNSKNVLDGICHRYAEIRKDNRRLTLCTFEIYNFVMCFFFVCFVASWLRTPPVCDCPGPTTLPAGYGRAVSAT